MRYLFIKWLNSNSKKNNQTSLDPEGKYEKEELREKLPPGWRKSTTNTDELLEFILDIIKHVRSKDCHNLSVSDFTKFGNQAWKDWKDAHSRNKSADQPQSKNCCSCLLIDYKKRKENMEENFQFFTLGWPSHTTLNTTLYL